MRREINLSIVIPVYNSETILEELITLIDKKLEIQQIKAIKLQKEDKL